MARRTKASGRGTGFTPYLLAVCHEVGNHLAAARLSAHLIGRSRNGREIVDGARTIEGLTTQAAALLATVRPLLRDDGARPGPSSPGRLLEALDLELEALGVDRGAVQVRIPRRIAEMRAITDLVQPALVNLALSAQGAAGPKGSVRVSARRDGQRVRIRVADDGPPIDLEQVRSRSVQRGRALAVSIAEALVRRAGGKVEVSAGRGGTRVDLLFRAL
jgi:signal transduction histidine kinase